MRINKGLCALGLGFVFAQSAYSAVIAPSVMITVDGYEYSVPQEKIIADPGSDRWFVDNYYMNLPGTASIMVSGTLDPDPSIAYGLTVTDFGAPSTFSFVFAEPIVPTGSPNFVTGSVVGGLTDATGDGVGISTTLADMDGDGVGEIQINEVGLPLTNMGVDVGRAQAYPAGLAGAHYTYGSYAAGPIAGPGPGPWTTLSATVAFGLSGNGDVVALTGFASIEVPEPGLMGLGLAALGILARRRRK